MRLLENPFLTPLEEPRQTSIGAAVIGKRRYATKPVVDAIGDDANRNAVTFFNANVSSLARRGGVKIRRVLLPTPLRVRIDEDV